MYILYNRLLIQLTVGYCNTNISYRGSKTMKGVLQQIKLLISKSFSILKIN